MTQTYVLYTAKRSGSACIEVMLNVLGLEHELKDAAPWTTPVGEYFEELKTVNPLAQLPTLVTPGGEVLTESVAILWTLVERHPANAADWVPAPSTRDRAACLRWMMFGAVNAYGAVGVADYPARWTTSKPAPTRAAVRRAAVARMKLAWSIIAQAFPQKRGFMFGERPMVCDVYLANLSRWWKMRDYLKEKHPAFAGMMQRVDRHPAVAPVWKRHFS